MSFLPARRLQSYLRVLLKTSHVRYNKIKKITIFNHSIENCTKNNNAGKKTCDFVWENN